MNTDLADKHCKPCEGGVDPLQPEQVAELMKGLHADWTLSDDGLQISRRFCFPAFPPFWRMPRATDVARGWLVAATPLGA